MPRLLAASVECDQVVSSCILTLLHIHTPNVFISNGTYQTPARHYLAYLPTPADTILSIDQAMSSCIAFTNETMYHLLHFYLFIVTRLVPACNVILDIRYSPTTPLAAAYLPTPA